MQVKIDSTQLTRICFLEESNQTLSLPNDACVFYDRKVRNMFRLSKTATTVALPSGEQAKTEKVLFAILRHLMQKNISRQQTIVAIGGGAVCDVVSLAASLYRRGCPLIIVPTTLLSMVDAAIGGKTAINIAMQGRRIKNPLGSFYAADSILLRPAFLASLPYQERLSGAGELLKQLLIGGHRLHLPSIKKYLYNCRIEKDFIAQIRHAIALKIKIVEADPFEQNIRAVLNYGHTVGHALESTCNLAHGQAIAWGMVVESALVNTIFSDELLALLLDLGFTPAAIKLKAKDLTSAMTVDKKGNKNSIKMMVVDSPGSFTEIQMRPAELAAFTCDFYQKKL